MKLKRCLLGTGLLVLIGMGGACAHESKYESARETGQKVGEAVATKTHLVDQLALLDEREVALADLALRRSSNTAVRAFAQQLIENHQQHHTNLAQYAEASALSLAVIELSTNSTVEGTGGAGTVGMTEAVQKSSEQYDEELSRQVGEFKDQVQELLGMSGAEFDKEFLELIRYDQKRGRELTEKGLKEYSDDAALALLLSRSAPVYERQEEQARVLRESIN